MMSLKWLPWVAGGAALAWGGAWTRRALANSQHVVRDPCITSSETHENLLYMLDSFQAVMAGRPVTWWIDYGCLLGAWRTGELLPWDHDLDISYLATDRAALNGAGPALSQRGIGLDLGYYGMYYRGTKLDLEPWSRHGDLLVRTDPTRRDWLSNLHDANCDDFLAALIEPLWQIRLCGRLVPCPQDPDRLLRSRYPTHRLHPRLSLPHKLSCWACPDFWRAAEAIYRSNYQPEVIPQPGQAAKGGA